MEGSRMFNVNKIWIICVLCMAIAATASAEIEDSTAGFERDLQETDGKQSEGLALGYEKDYISDENQRLQRRSKELSREIVTLKSKNSRLDKSLESSRKNLVELDAKVKVQTAERQQLKSTVDAKARIAAKEQSHVQQKRQNLAELSAEKRSLQTEIKHLEQQLINMRRRALQLSAQTQRERTHISRLNARKRDLSMKANIN